MLDRNATLIGLAVRLDRSFGMDGGVELRIVTNDLGEGQLETGALARLEMQQ
jgi:hypothetical protein